VRFAVAALLGIAGFARAAGAGGSGPILVVPISGTVDEGMAHLVERAVRGMRRQTPAVEIEFDRGRIEGRAVGEHESRLELEGPRSAVAAARPRPRRVAEPGLPFRLDVVMTNIGRVANKESRAGDRRQGEVPIVDELDRKAQQVAQALGGVPGVSNVQLQSPPGAPEVVVRLRPADAATRYNYAMMLGRTSHFDEAQRELEAALRADPKLAEQTSPETIEHNRLLIAALDRMSLEICWGVKKEIKIPATGRWTRPKPHW